MRLTRSSTGPRLAPGPMARAAGHAPPIAPQHATSGVLPPTPVAIEDAP